MSQYTISSLISGVFNRRALPLGGLADGDTITITFPNDKYNIVNTKAGGGIITQNVEGNRMEVVWRCQKGQEIDQIFNDFYYTQENDFLALVPASLDLVRSLGSGTGIIMTEIYKGTGGIITKLPDSGENIGGDAKVAVSEWSFVFSNGKRTLQS